ncbi:uncharacterized protein LOC106166326 [Lingula anatina]|uniref:Uncharacterized protein LOC106166326 n=1 Tax=Lingula anatina TaxID=7574 RepID=A0A1S3IQG1_LINAN|nr:uncharacterized protein LOC106166326 [Lingula anatina]|eukprot:XP_013400308.1 uncharacterized protein LOC106166326 [Lingula anatina]
MDHENAQFRPWYGTTGFSSEAYRNVPPVSHTTYPTAQTMSASHERGFKRKSLVEAYLLWLALGLFGAHHFYLNRPLFGIMYLTTFGLCGCGWLIDLFRLPCLVKDANKLIEDRTPMQLRKRSVGDAYVLWLPFGLLGWHHFYLRRPGIGLYYSFTLGGLGTGFIYDLFRMPCLVKRRNRELEVALQRPQDAWRYRYRCHLDDAYGLIFPLGFLGLHHFYLRRFKWGLLYLFTFGIFGIGWIIDFFRLPSLVKEANRENQPVQAHGYIVTTARHPSFPGQAVPNSGQSQSLTTEQSGTFTHVNTYSGPPANYDPPTYHGGPQGAFVFLFLIIRSMDHENAQFRPWYGTTGFSSEAYRNVPPVSHTTYPTAQTMSASHERGFKRKSLVEAYLLWLALGLFGAHHFYLNRPLFGIMYLTTFGLCGCGWLIDLFRLPCLVKDANKLIEDRTPMQLRKRSVGDAYVLWLPFGLLGWHHFYLRRPGIGLYYSFTLGGLGTGFIYDLFRMPCLVKRRNRELEVALQRPQDAWRYRYRCHLDDAYGLIFPLGFLGLHHFYLRRFKWGLLYLFTFGIFGIGWIIDFFRLPSLVKEANRENQPVQAHGYIVTTARHPSFPGQAVPNSGQSQSLTTEQSGTFTHVNTYSGPPVNYDPPTYHGGPQDHDAAPPPPYSEIAGGTSHGFQYNQGQSQPYFSGLQQQNQYQQQQQQYQCQQQQQYQYQQQRDPFQQQQYTNNYGALAPHAPPQEKSH